MELKQKIDEFEEGVVDQTEDGLAAAMLFGLLQSALRAGDEEKVFYYTGRILKLRRIN